MTDERDTERFSGRRFRRYPAQMGLVLQSGTRTLPVITTDIGLCGLGVASDEPLDLYGLVDLLVPMPGEEAIDLTGLVSHRNRDARWGSTKAGIHLHFFGPYRPERWQRLVQALAVRQRLDALAEKPAPLERLPFFSDATLPETSSAVDPSRAAAAGRALMWRLDLD